MKNFVKLIQQVYEEKFSTVTTKLVQQKTPVTFLSLAPVAQTVESVKDLRNQGLNITRTIVTDITPPPGQP